MAAGGGGELQLLGCWYSPYAIRARVALGVKGLSYEYAEEDLFSKSDLLLRSNPVHKKVPVLIHGGRPVCESLVVVQYVDDAWPAPPLLPADPHARATARFWVAYVDDKFFQAWRPLFRSTTDEQRAEAFKGVLPQVEVLEQAFMECSSQGKKAFFGGDAIGLVDIALGGFLAWFKVVDEVSGTCLLDEARFPGLAAWADRFMGVDAVREAMPDDRRLLEHYRGFLAKLASPAAPPAGCSS